MDTKEIQERYNGIYKRNIFFGNRKIIYALMSEKIQKLGRFEKMLDIGCGSGAIEFMNHCHAKKIFAFDISQTAIGHAKKISKRLGIGNIVFSVGDAINLRYADESFDLVVQSEVLEHVTDWKLSLGEAVRVLKPGGYFILSTPNDRNPLGAVTRLAKAITKKELSCQPFDRPVAPSKIKKYCKGIGLGLEEQTGFCFGEALLLAGNRSLIGNFIISLPEGLKSRLRKMPKPLVRAVFRNYPNYQKAKLDRQGIERYLSKKMVFNTSRSPFNNFGANVIFVFRKV